MKVDPEVWRLVNDHSALVDVAGAKMADAWRMLNAALTMPPSAQQLAILDGASALFDERGAMTPQINIAYKAARDALVRCCGVEYVELRERQSAVDQDSLLKSNMEARVAAYAAQYGG